jgi:hypothetical protein
VSQGKIFEMCIKKTVSEGKDKTGVIFLDFNIFFTASIIHTVCACSRFSWKLFGNYKKRKETCKLKSFVLSRSVVLSISIRLSRKTLEIRIHVFPCCRLSIYLSIYLFIYLSIYPSICISHRHWQEKEFLRAHSFVNVTMYSGNACESWYVT